MSWFSDNKSDDHVAQIRREFTSQIKELQQSMQELQQNLAEEIQRLMHVEEAREQNLANEIQQLKHTEEVREQNLADEMRQLKQQRVSYWSIAQNTIDQMQTQVNELSKQISRFAPEPMSTEEQNLGKLHALDVYKAQIATNAVIDYDSTHQKIEKEFEVAKQTRDKERANLSASIRDLFSSREQDTDKLQALGSEEEDDPSVMEFP